MDTLAFLLLAARRYNHDPFGQPLADYSRRLRQAHRPPPAAVLPRYPTMDGPMRLDDGLAHHPLMRHLTHRRRRS